MRKIFVPILTIILAAAILLMNLLVWVIDHSTAPYVYGYKKGGD